MFFNGPARSLRRLLNNLSSALMSSPFCAAFCLTKENNQCGLTGASKDGPYVE